MTTQSTLFTPGIASCMVDTCSCLHAGVQCELGPDSEELQRGVSEDAPARQGMGPAKTRAPCMPELCFPLSWPAVQVIDAFLVYAFLTAAIQVRHASVLSLSIVTAACSPERESSMPMQFLYMLCVGTFPFNSFLSGFFSSLGFFVLLGEPSHLPSCSCITVL